MTGRVNVPSIPKTWKILFSKSKMVIHFCARTLMLKHTVMAYLFIYLNGLFIVEGITSTTDKSQSKWIADCENYENLLKWDKSYTLPFYCTKETQLQTFQFKFLHRKIATNDYLFK